MNNPFDEETIDQRNSMKEHRHWTREQAEEDMSFAIEQWRKEREKLMQRHAKEQVNLWKDIVSDEEAYR